MVASVTGEPVEDIADAYSLETDEVLDAVQWAAEHEDEMREAIERRIESLEGLDAEYPEGIEPPSEADASEIRRRHLDVLDRVVERLL